MLPVAPSAVSPIPIIGRQPDTTATIPVDTRGRSLRLARPECLYSVST